MRLCCYNFIIAAMQASSYSILLFDRQDMQGTDLRISFIYLSDGIYYAQTKFISHKCLIWSY
jgi:hypothetical protein